LAEKTQKQLEDIVQKQS